jgi:hypothetical protein
MATTSTVTSSLTNTDGDANTALAELDQGLRSGRLGEQVRILLG